VTPLRLEERTKHEAQRLRVSYRFCIGDVAKGFDNVFGKISIPTVLRPEASYRLFKGRHSVPSHVLNTLLLQPMAFSQQGQQGGRKTTTPDGI
jgi:hypothetical protein